MSRAARPAASGRGLGGTGPASPAPTRVGTRRPEHSAVLGGTRSCHYPLGLGHTPAGPGASESRLPEVTRALYLIQLLCFQEPGWEKEPSPSRSVTFWDWVPPPPPSYSFSCFLCLGTSDPNDFNRLPSWKKSFHRLPTNPFRSFWGAINSNRTSSTGQY